MTGDVVPLALFCGLKQLFNKCSDTLFDLIPDRTDGVDVLSCGIGDRPIDVSLAGVEGAFVAAAHGDDDV